MASGRVQLADKWLGASKPHSMPPFTATIHTPLTIYARYVKFCEFVALLVCVYYYSTKWNYYSRALSWPQESQEHAARSVNVWELEVDD